MFLHYRFHVVVCALLLFGCGRQDTDSPMGNDSSHHDDSHHDHNHDLGPNGGHLIVLGNEEYHAEWLHDDEKGSLTVIILDSTAHEEVAVEATSITINVVVNDEPKHYELSRTEESDGKGARFEIVNSELIVALNIGSGVQAKLLVQINGVPYSGRIEHASHH